MSKKLLYILLAIATFAVYYLVIHPLYSGIGGVWQPEQNTQSLRMLNGEYDQTVSQADDLLNQAKTLQSQYAKISDDDKAKMAVMVPVSIDRVRLLSEFNDMILSTGLTPKNLSIADGGSSANGINTMNVSFSVETSYPKFKDLMDVIEKSLRLYSIDGVTFTAGKEGDTTSFQVQLETYYLK